MSNCVQIQAQSNISSVSYDQQIAHKLADIENAKDNITLSYNNELPVIQATQSIVASLICTLLNTVVNERLSASFANIEAMLIALKGTKESICFQNYATTKATAAEQGNFLDSRTISNQAYVTFSTRKNISFKSDHLLFNIVNSKTQRTINHYNYPGLSCNVL